VILAVLVGAALRLATLGLQSLDEDETVTAWLVHLPAGRMLCTIPQTESTPPLYYVLAWVWARVFGWGAVGLRSLSALMGTATIPVCALTARRLAGRSAGVVVAVLAALSPALIWYSQEARSYALLVLTSAASLHFFTRLIAGRRGAADAVAGDRALWLWALMSSLALLSHYFAAFIVGPEGLLLLFAAVPSARRRVLAALAAVAAVGIALLPLAVRQGRSPATSWIATIPFSDRMTDVPAQLLLGEGRPFFRFYALIVGVAVLAPVLALLLRGGRTGRRLPLILISVAACGVALPALFDVAAKAILIDRNLLGVVPVLAVAAALGIARCRPRLLGLGSLAVVCTMFLAAVEMVISDPLHQREDWRDAAHALGSAPVTRALVYAPATNNPPPVPPLVPFQAVYLTDLLTMPDHGASVREIDVLDVRDDLSARSPPPSPVLPGPGFKLIGRIVKPSFTLFRFAAPHPLHVNPDDLIDGGLIDNRDGSEILVGLQHRARLRGRVLMP
jgi:4-amino-4-deoxy-L-arabinose transferase-like glycosyltransferase